MLFLAEQRFFNRHCLLTKLSDASFRMNRFCCLTRAIVRMGPQPRVMDCTSFAFVRELSVTESIFGLLSISDVSRRLAAD
jgi:hypothetical protein